MQNHKHEILSIKQCQNIKSKLFKLFGILGTGKLEFVSKFLMKGGVSA